jgi:hypothetical protein
MCIKCYVLAKQVIIYSSGGLLYAFYIYVWAADVFVIAASIPSCSRMEYWLTLCLISTGTGTEQYGGHPLAMKLEPSTKLNSDEK